MDEQVPAVHISRNDGLFLRGIAILFVLLGHTGYIEWGGAAGVVLFLFLSGYGLECSCHEKGLSGFWRKRIWNVWLPYIPVGFLGVLMMGIRNPSGILCSLLGLDCGRIADPTMWYISYIFAWYAVFYVMDAAARRIRNQSFGMLLKLIGLLIAGFLMGQLCGARGLWHENAGADNYAICFPLGVAFAWASRHKVRKGTVQMIQAGILFLLISYLMRVYPRPAHVPTMLTMGMIPVLLVECVDVNVRYLSWITKLGKYAYPIYLFEGLLLSRRNSWFYALGVQQLIDMAFIGTSVLLAVIYWNGIFGKIRENFHVIGVTGEAR